MIDFSIANAWVEYKKKAIQLGIPKKNIPDLLAFREEITDGLLRGNKSLEKVNGGDYSSPARKPSIASQPGSSTIIRLDMIGHWPIFLDQKNASRCAREGCEQKFMISCNKCKKALCLKRDRNCFLLYHK